MSLEQTGDGHVEAGPDTGRSLSTVFDAHPAPFGLGFPGRLLVRQLVPFALAVLLLFLARDRLIAIDWSEVWLAARQTSAWQWLGGLLATMISFYALGQYDAVVHRMLGTGVGGHAAGRSGMAAIAISQTVGFGLFTGSLVRWRLLPGMSLGAATKVTLTVTISFLAAWAPITAAAVLAFLWPAASIEHALLILAAAVIGLTAAGIAMLILQPRLTVFGRVVWWPPLLAVLRILVLTLIDTAGAAMALYVFLPADLAPELTMMLPAFLLALGAGLVLGTPGGVGPFEVVLISLLPMVPSESLAASILCYRAVYFALPAIVAGLLVLAGAGENRRAPSAPAFCARPQKLRQAEVLIHRQGQHEFLDDGQGQAGWLSAQAGNCAVALFDPISGPGAAPRLLERVIFHARAREALPCLYKIGPRTAVCARAARWRVHPMAEEYWLTPAIFSLTTPARASLRRKLRHAQQAGVMITCHAAHTTPEQMPWADLARIDTHWSRRHGGARGFSMGRFSKDYVAGQRVYLAQAEGVLTAFVTFHETQDEWALDLVRQSEGTADGTIHSLIVAALSDAKALGISRLSLAAAPLPGLGLRGQIGRIADRFAHKQGAHGLRQFKQSFAPDRTRLYLAARTRVALLWAAFDIARAIALPRPLSDVHAQNTLVNNAHEAAENLGFDVC